MLNQSLTTATASRDSGGTTTQEQSPEVSEVPHSRSLGETELLPWIVGPLIALATLVVPLTTVVAGRHQELHQQAPLAPGKDPLQRSIKAASAAESPAH